MGKGRIVGESEDRSDGSPTYSAIVEYGSGDEIKRFTSRYGSSSRAEIGKEVNIVIPPSPKSPEIYSDGNRFLFTIIPFVFGAIFIVVGATIKPINP